MNLGACARLGRAPETGTWFRALEPQFLPSALSTAHTAARPTRFSAGPTLLRPFEILYLCENPMVALWEVGALLGSPLEPGGVVALPGRAWTTIHVQVQLREVADLAQVSQQVLLGTTVQELTGDWRGYRLRGPATSVPEPVGNAPTQDLGEALFSLPGLEGFRTVSAKLPFHVNLIVFPEKLQPGSRVEFRHPPTGLTYVVNPPTKKRRRSR
jgi:hypothetical protein